MPQNNFGGWQGGQTPYYPNNYPGAQNVVPTMPVEQKGITTITTASSREAAENYPVAAGQTACIMNFRTPTSGFFWLKTTDIYGRGLPLLEFEFVQKVDGAQTPAPGQQMPETNQNDFVPRKDFEEMRTMIADLYKELKGTG